MNIRAKVRCTTITHRCAAYGASPDKHESDEVELSPVSDPANATWSKWTPGGSFKMTINNPDALKAFEVGATYFVDFTPAPQKEADERSPG